ncbi:MAG: flavodoxin [Eubacteriales bacterium]|nr:flavodoxin [Eubacteriales bacterium]
MENLKIGIILHSQTGNTLSVGEGIKEKFEAAGQAVQLERIFIEGADKNPELVKNARFPDIGKYDILILGAPVWGFSLSPVMAELLKRTDSLENKKLILFLTQMFPFKWMGGNRALKQFTNLCAAKDGKIVETGIVNWSSRKRGETINGMIERFGKAV